MKKSSQSDGFTGDNPTELISKHTKQLNVRFETIKLLKEDIGKSFIILVNKKFLDLTP